jgi:hypothetical protein
LNRTNSNFTTTLRLTPELASLFVADAHCVGLDVSVEVTLIAGDSGEEDFIRDAGVSRHLLLMRGHDGGDEGQVEVEEVPERRGALRRFTANFKRAEFVAAGLAAVAERVVELGLLAALDVIVALDFAADGDRSVGAVLETSVVLVLEHVVAEGVKNLDLVAGDGDVDAALSDEAALVEEGDDFVSFVLGNGDDTDRRLLAAVATLDDSLEGLDAGEGDQPAEVVNTSSFIEEGWHVQRELSKEDVASFGGNPSLVAILVRDKLLVELFHVSFGELHDGVVQRNRAVWNEEDSLFSEDLVEVIVPAIEGVRRVVESSDESLEVKRGRNLGGEVEVVVVVLSVVVMKPVVVRFLLAEEANLVSCC